MGEVVEEEEGAGDRPITREGADDRLREDREHVEEPGACDREGVRLGVPDHHVARPAAQQEGEEEQHTRPPGLRPRPVEPGLDEHPERVDDREDDGGVRRVPVHRPNPASRPYLLVHPEHGFVGPADPIEDEQIDAGQQQKREGHDDQCPALVERVVLRPVEAVEEGVEAPDESLQHPWRTMCASRTLVV